MYRSASGDEVTRVLVKDLAGAFKGPCTLLAQLFSAPEWHATTDAVRDDGWKLVEMPWQDFLANEDSRALSYRWDNLVKFTSKCKPPGEAETEVKEWTVPASFLEALRLAGRGPLWVDFLCHLNGPQLPQVILSMGQLYANATVLPLYLHRYTRALSEIDEESEESAANEAFMMLGQALGRGWVFQEIAFGPLDRGVVQEFLPPSKTPAWFQRSDPSPTPCRPS